VSYRSQHPDEETQKEVMNKMKENNIDSSQLVEYKTDTCKQAEPSTERGNPTKGVGGINGGVLPAISDIFGK